MSDLLEHKGYYATVEFSATDKTLFGKVIGVNSLISNIRVSPELHKTLAIYSASHGQTLNSAVEEAIKRYVLV